MASIMVRLWDRYDDEIYIRVPCGRPKRKKVEAKATVMERVVLWWSRMKAEAV
jgi:hypothetical protein